MLHLSDGQDVVNGQLLVNISNRNCFWVIPEPTEVSKQSKHVLSDFKLLVFQAKLLCSLGDGRRLHRKRHLLVTFAISTLATSN